MEFSPQNHIVQLCLKGMIVSETGHTENAYQLFLQAWHEATNDFEKYLAAWFVGKYHQDIHEKLKWLETALQLALAIKDEAVTSALPTVYRLIGKSYEEMGDDAKAKMNYDAAASFPTLPTDKGPFFHGTKADLEVGEQLIPGYTSNYQADLIMNHIYFTASMNGAGLAAALAKGNGPDRVYMVEPTGRFENDPNVTDKKFPGNVTRSYRTSAPLKIIGEIKDWARLTTEDLQIWKDRLANNKGDIIN